ncbi:10770_t:CDS:2, partial [Entrophospora sp. SA101]
TYHNGMKRTTFLKQIKDGPFIYHEDLGGLCSICCEFGYEVFDDLKKLISVHIVDKSNQIMHGPGKYPKRRKFSGLPGSSTFEPVSSVGLVSASKTKNDKLQNGEMESIHYGFNQDRPQYELKSSFPILYAQMKLYEI